MSYQHLEELQSDWRGRRREIERRLGAFRQMGKASDEELFAEVAFCLFAIQTSAHRSDDAVRGLAENRLLWRGSARDIAAFLRRRVRFHNHKAAYLVAARERFLGAHSLRSQLDESPPDLMRAWLVREVDGFGYKEASHFLRNVGRGEAFAILDRHILKNLRHHGVIRTIPESLTEKRYLSIEQKVRDFAEAVAIPMAAIDLVFWSRETGEVFK
ncbi:MAG: N-glycosylase/DNA lyase [Methanobacteriota archaeon]|nr:MAG: N-glycosylase/DNA lyase [Euryarchaeota archaeon]